MAKLQPCPKCGAQFDVSAMAAGSAFTCGACGAVVTAGAASAPAARTPAPARAAVGAASPSRAIPAPGAKAAGSRGPQYVPVDRHRESALGTPTHARDEEEGPSRRGRGERRGSERGAPRPGRLSPAALAGIGLGALVIVVGGILLVSSKKDAGSGKESASGPGGHTPPNATPGGPLGKTPGAPTPGAPGNGSPTPSDGTGDSVDAIKREFDAKSRPTPAEMKRFFDRFNAAGPAGASYAKDLAGRVIREVDPDYEPAHLVLGHKKFDHKMPDISFLKYNYIRVVEDAIEQRWFDDDEAYRLAEAAWEKTAAHEKRLLEDSTFRALDTARIEISHDKEFKDYNYEAIFADPYLICYSSEERTTAAEFEKMSHKQRQAKLTELEKRRAEFAPILAEKAKIYQALYKEFLRRYEDSCALHPLMDEYGGRKDLPKGKASFKDGCPLIIWIFSNRKAWDEFHAVVKGDPANPGVAGYFSPGTGWVYLYDEENNREFEINKTVHEGTHQLEHWFQRQKREWGHPVVPQSFFGEGFAEYMGAVTMAVDRSLTFHGINRPRLMYLKAELAAAKSESRKMQIFPLKDLVSFEGYGAVGQWGAEHKFRDPLGLFYAQSWAFVYFLNEFENHKYQSKFNQFLNDMLIHPKFDNDTAHGYAAEQLKKRLGIRSADDWAKLHKEFATWYEKDLIPMDLGKLGGEPPARDNWPGYKAPDALNPLDDGKKPDATKPPEAPGK